MIPNVSKKEIKILFCHPQAFTNCLAELCGPLRSNIRAKRTETLASVRTV